MSEAKHGAGPTESFRATVVRLVVTWLAVVVFAGRDVTILLSQRDRLQPPCPKTDRPAAPEQGD